jgi:hypothetical protein
VNDAIKYAERRVITFRELTDRPGMPSQIMREIEAETISRLARAVALSGKRFDGWPTLTVHSEYDVVYARDMLTLTAEVAVR